MNDTIPTLEQFIEPSPVKFIPDAPGWYVLGILLVIILIGVGLLIYNDYRKNRYRKVSLNWLKEKEKQLLENNDHTGLVYAADMLAKRISIRNYGRESVASLQDATWIDFLNKTSHSALFTSTDKQIILSVYDPEASISKQQAIDFLAKIKQWIKKHRARL